MAGRMARTGFSKNTTKHITQGAGIYVKNLELGEEIEPGNPKIIGATQGGGTVTIAMVLRHIPVDGVIGHAKGLTEIDEVTATMQINVLEVKQSIIEMALGACDTEELEDGKVKITGRLNITDTDYLDNISWIGYVGDTEMIIMLHNAMNSSGLVINNMDKENAVIPLTMEATYKWGDEKPPYTIIINGEEATLEELGAVV